tara:strand:- start:128113 stop:128874 length:762 start_codon:yes stop_codon:yes gene_type:complete
MTEETLAFYCREGDGYKATGLGISPWNDQAQMGVALAGLAAHCLEKIPCAVPMLTTRLTIDIMGTVPPIALTPLTRILRDGRRMQTVEVSLEADGRSWLRATALRIRTEQSPAVTAPATRPFPPEGRDPSLPRATKWAETILLQGGFHQAGPGAQWVRFTSCVVAGKPLTPLERLAMVADFGSGVAPVLLAKEWTQANTDISLHISRTSDDEWLLIDANSESAGNGIGVVHSRISDRSGALGMAHQSLFLNQR